MSLSKWGSRTLSSKRVWAETVGFFHRRWMKRLKGEGGGGKILCLRMHERLMGL